MKSRKFYNPSILLLHILRQEKISPCQLKEFSPEENAKDQIEMQKDSDKPKGKKKK